MGIPKSSIEGEVGNDLGNLFCLNPVVEGEAEVERKIDSLIAGDQHRQCDHAAIAWRKLRPSPQISEDCSLNVAIEGRRTGLYVYVGLCGATG